MRKNGWFARNRSQQTLRWMHSAVDQELRRFFQDHTLVRSTIDALERDVLEGRTTPVRAARMLLDVFSTQVSRNLTKPRHSRT
jgi:LAO/AO transport system kinase